MVVDNPAALVQTGEVQAAVRGTSNFAIFPETTSYYRMPILGEVEIKLGSSTPAPDEETDAPSRSALQGAATGLVVSMFAELEESLREARDLGEAVPTETSLRACRSIAQRLAVHVGLAPKVKSAVFLENSGHLALVLQSLLTHRRLTLRVRESAASIEAVQTDEWVRTQTSVWAPDAIDARELAEWLCR